MRADLLLPDLTIPAEGSRTARDVLSRAIGRLLAEIRPLVRGHAHLLPPADAAAFERLVSTLLKDRVGPLASVLRRPNVGALVRYLRRPPSGADAAVLRELVGLITFELAVMQALPFEVSLTRFPRRVLSMAAGVAFDLPDQPVTLASGRLRSGGAAGAIDLDLASWTAAETGLLELRRPFSPIDGSTVLAVEDNNPLALVEAHPDKSGNAVDLGGASVATWTASLRAAFALVATYLPDLRAEMELYLAQMVPVGVHQEQHLSASYQEAIGTVYLSLHPSPMTMVEALIHEFQHNKLNALLELDDVLENAFFPLYPSPVRPDPRPLHGVLLAVHAFLPVALLYEKMIADHHPLAADESFHARRSAIEAINTEGATLVLEHGRPTPVGAGLLGEIRGLASVPALP